MCVTSIAVFLFSTPRFKNMIKVEFQTDGQCFLVRIIKEEISSELSRNTSIYHIEVIPSPRLPMWDFRFFAVGLDLSNTDLCSWIVLAASPSGFHATCKTYRKFCKVQIL